MCRERDSRALFDCMNGVLLVDKPQGLTSHDVVARARRALGTRAIGHAGTLDPMATGLLILLVGYATRLNEYVLHRDKSYSATLKLGERTDTDDAEGRILQTRPVPDISHARLNELAAKFTGEIEQVPPQYSAVSKNGQRAYVLARKGEHVDIDPRRVTITNLRFITVNLPLAEFEMSCGSGTYVRSVARDLGEALGCGAHLVALRRTRIGDFGVDQAVSVENIRADCVLLPDAAVTHLPKAQLDTGAALKFMLGQPSVLAGWTTGVQAVVGVYDQRQRLIGIGAVQEHESGGQLKPSKVFDIDAA